MDLEKDLNEVIDFFNFHKKNKEHFADKIEFHTKSNGYVRILKEKVKEQNFPAYEVSCIIDEVVNSDSKDFRNYREYKLTISFDRHI